jgi:hypothetical protein
VKRTAKRRKRRRTCTWLDWSGHDGCETHLAAPTPENGRVYARVLSVSGTEKKKRKTINDMNDDEDDYD